jgi:hypothetical protein
MANLITTSSQLQCPHGGQVQITSSNAKAKADGSFIARTNDTFVINACPFLLPNGTAHPCAKVQWTKTALKVKPDGALALAKDSMGMCLAADQAPQGAVIINTTQTKVSGL